MRALSLAQTLRLVRSLARAGAVPPSARARILAVALALFRSLPFSFLLPSPVRIGRPPGRPASFVLSGASHAARPPDSFFSSSLPPPLPPPLLLLPPPLPPLSLTGARAGRSGGGGSQAGRGPPPSPGEAESERASEERKKGRLRDKQREEEEERGLSPGPSRRRRLRRRPRRGLESPQKTSPPLLLLVAVGGGPWRGPHSSAAAGERRGGCLAGLRPQPPSSSLCDWRQQTRPAANVFCVLGLGRGGEARPRRGLRSSSSSSKHRRLQQQQQPRSAWWTRKARRDLRGTDSQVSVLGNCRALFFFFCLFWRRGERELDRTALAQSSGEKATLCARKDVLFPPPPPIYFLFRSYF